MGENKKEQETIKIDDAIREIMQDIEDFARMILESILILKIVCKNRDDLLEFIKEMEEPINKEW